MNNSRCGDEARRTWGTRLDQHDLLSPAATVEHQRTIIHELLFPLDAFDLSITRNFRDLPPPDSPYSY
jgi:hypothetical protein